LARYCEVERAGSGLSDLRLRLAAGNSAMDDENQKDIPRWLLVLIIVLTLLVANFLVQAFPGI
jgi:hypothetical protein